LLKAGFRGRPSGLRNSTRPSVAVEARVIVGHSARSAPNN
jgi:hypothetical protein